MKLKYIMLLQIRKDFYDEYRNVWTFEKEYKAVKLPEYEDDNTKYLYDVLSHFALHDWVNLCGVIPDLQCLPDDKERKFWEDYLIDYEDLALHKENK